MRIKKKTNPKLTYDEQYGYYTYYAGGQQLFDLLSVIIAGKKYAVTRCVKKNRVYEMGRSYDVSNSHYYVNITFAGKRFDMDLLEIIDSGLLVRVLDCDLKPSRPCKASPLIR